MWISFNRAWILLVLMVIAGFAAMGRAQATEQTLSVHWEELTGADFIVWAPRRVRPSCRRNPTSEYECNGDSTKLSPLRRCRSLRQPQRPSCAYSVC